MRWTLHFVVIFGVLAFSVVHAGEAGKDLKALQGEWQAVELIGQGKKATEEEVKQFRLVIKGNDLSIGNRKSTFKIDPTKSPKAIDVTPLDGPQKGKVIPGIYALEKGQLRICISNGPNDSDRPKEFKAEPGTGYVVITLERAK